MRFILNFIFFGILFYLIYIYFPDAFHTLVSWVSKIYDFFKELIIEAYNRSANWRHESPSTPAPSHEAFLLPFLALFRRK